MKKQKNSLLIILIILFVLSEFSLIYIIKVKNDTINKLKSSSKEGFLGKKLAYDLNQTLYIEYYSVANFTLIKDKGIKKVSTNDIMKEYSEENVKPDGINSKNKPKPLKYYKQFLCVTTNDSINVDCVRATIFW